MSASAPPGARDAPAERPRRLFFALWPDDVLRSSLAPRLDAWIRGYPCRPQRPDQWHLTLEFLGSVAESRVGAIREVAADVRGVGPVEIVLDRLEHWAKPQVLCLTSSDPVPGPAAELVRQIRAGLAARGFTPESREFRPHLTLARKAKQRVPPRVVEPFHWPGASFALVESVADATGSRYEPLAWWNPAA